MVWWGFEPNLEKGVAHCSSNLTYTQNPIENKSKQFAKKTNKIDQPKNVQTKLNKETSVW
jgi:hypothetical protein